MTKAAQIHLVKALAMTAGSAIRVNSVSPGIMLTVRTQIFADDLYNTMNLVNRMLAGLGSSVHRGEIGVCQKQKSIEKTRGCAGVSFLRPDIDEMLIFPKRTWRSRYCTLPIPNQSQERML